MPIRSNSKYMCSIDQPRMAAHGRLPSAHFYTTAQALQARRGIFNAIAKYK